VSFVSLFNPGTGSVEIPTNGVIVSGNPDLKPETARIYTAGLVWSPKFVPGILTLSADYYGIYQKNLVLFSAPQTIVQAYYSQGLFSNLITFNPDGSFNQINANAMNVASRDVEGLDLGLIYQMPRFDWGQLTLNSEWNYTLKYKVQFLQGGPSTNFLGRYSDPGTGDLSPGAIPYWKGYVDLAYQLGGFGAGLRVNYIGGYRDDPRYIQVSPPERKVREYTTLDLRVSYEFKRPEPVGANNNVTAAYGKDGKETPAPAGTYGKPSFWSKLLGGTTIQAGIINVFDTEPPFAAGAQDTTYDTSLYDIRDRVWYVSLRKAF
jgi:outer membrane receptor protein involved in Fe transport